MKITDKRRRSERGYILLALIFAVTLIIIGLAAAVPTMRSQIQRDREDELIHRAHQYTRAIQLYYRKFGRYPSTIEQLEDTNNVRFLRQRYKDPITGKDDWHLIQLGTARIKPRPAYLPGATPASALGSSPSNGLGAGTGAAGVNGAQGGGGAFGSSSGGGAFGSSGAGGLTGPGISNASDISKSLGGGQTFGGGQFVGVASVSNKEALKEIDGKTKYSEWEFVYDPTLDMSRGAAGGVPVNGASGPGAPIQNQRPVGPSR